MEKKSTNRILEIHTEYNGTTLKTRKALLTIETYQNSFCVSMEKSNELRPICVTGTNNTNSQQVMAGPGVNNNPHPQYFVNEARYIQVLPGASNNCSIYGGHGTYVHPQQTNFSHQASSSRRVLEPPSNTFNPYGHGRFTMPEALNDSSNAHHAFHAPGTVRNELGYVTNEARPSQIFPSASNNYSFVSTGGRGGYIDPLHEPLNVNNFWGQASSFRHGYVSQPDSNTSNPYGNERFIMPSALNDNSYAQHAFHGPGTVRNELGHVTNEARPSQIFPSAFNNCRLVGTGGRGDFIDPGQASSSRDGYVLRPALNSTNPKSSGTIGNCGKSVHGNSTDENVDGASHQNYDKSTSLDMYCLKNERLKVIHRVRNCYKKNALTLHEKNKGLFEKSDWLQLTYTKDGSFKADMNCPVCLSNINPMYRRSGSWDFTNVKRHIVNIHSEAGKKKSGEPLAPSGSIAPLPALGNAAKIIGANCSEQNQTLIKSESSAEKKESVKPLTPLDNIVLLSVLDDNESDLSSENEDLMELSPQSNNDLDISFSDDLLTYNSSSSKQSSSDWSSLDTSFSDLLWTDLSSTSHSSKVTKQRKEENKEIELGNNPDGVKTTKGKSKRNKREGNKYEPLKRATSTRSKARKCSDSTTSSDSYRCVETTGGKGGRSKRESNKRDCPKRASSASYKRLKRNDREHPKRFKSPESKQKQKKRVQAESTSSSSETDESDSGGVTKRATVQSEEEEWRKPGVEYSWVKFTQRGKCFPGFIFPELNAKGQKLAQFITLKGELSDIKHPIWEKLHYKDVPEKYHQLYAKPFEIFNTENDSNYR